MSSSVDVAAALARQLGISETTAVEITRRIRAAGLFVRQTRSAASPAPSAQDAANLIVALMSGHSTRNVADAVTAAHGASINDHAQKKYFWAGSNYVLGHPENRKWFVDEAWRADKYAEHRRAPMREFTGEAYQEKGDGYSFPEVLASLIEILAAYPEFFHAFGASTVSYDPDRNRGEIEFFHSHFDSDRNEYEIQDSGRHFTFEFEDELNDFKGDLSRSATITFVTLNVAARAIARASRDRSPTRETADAALDLDGGQASVSFRTVPLATAPATFGGG